MSAFDGVPEFLMVVEAGGFSAAARRMNVSTAHISRQVARLEDRLSVKLLARSTRVVRPTEAGAAYYARMSDLAAGIEEANQSAAGAAAELAGRIRVSAAGAFAEEHVAPVLARFAQANRRITIEMDFNTRFVDLIDQGFDFAVRYGELADSGMVARRLVSREMVCAASPEYLAQNGAPQHPGDLKSHDCIIVNADRWNFADPSSGDPIDVRVSGRWRANNGHALLHAAIAGMGIAYAPQINLKSGLNSGALVQVLEGFEDKQRASWLVYPERRHMPARVRAAMDYLVASFE